MTTHRILITLFLALLLGCSKSQEGLNSDDRRLVPVYAELLILREQYQAPGSSLDSLIYRHRADSLLGTVNLSQADFSAKVSTIAESQKLFQEFQTEVRMYLDRKKSATNK